MDSSSQVSFSPNALSSEDDIEEDDTFCDISDFNNEDLFPMSSRAGLLENQIGTEVSEDSLREDIEKVDILPLDEVRWFCCTHKKKNWKPLLGYDSIRLEKEWRRFHYDNCSEEEVNRVCVRGGMYEIDVLKLRCHPIYWSSVDLSKTEKFEGEPVLRGSWFFEVNWQPLDEDLATRIEKEHLARWKGYDIGHIKELMNNKVMHSVQLGGCHVEWNSVTDVLFYKDATTHRAFRNIVQKFGVSKATSSGYRLHRGYREDAIMADRKPPVDNLVLVIHGIGAKSDRRKIVRNTADFRSACRRIQSKPFVGRCEFIPVEWRSRLKLDGDIVESITPKKGQGMRRFLNNTAMDIMYYASPLYRSEIVSGLRTELNRIHKLFMDRNPKFAGKISVFAHSLGNVIFHDILTNWHPGTMYGENEVNINGINIDFNNHLNFKIDTLISVGSPLGVFFCLRGYRPEDGTGTQDDIIPVSACRRIFNIFHPADPVAYRLEPLILPHYSNIPPVQISSYASIIKSQKERASSPMPSLNSEASQDDNNNEQSDLKENVTSIDSNSPSESPKLTRQPSYLRSVSSVVAGSAVRLGRGLWSRARGSSQSPTPEQQPQETEELPQPTTSSSPLIETSEEVVDAPCLDNRIDYELPEGFTESKLGYAALTSHTSYWSNQDLAMFMMTQLHTKEKETFEC